MSDLVRHDRGKLCFVLSGQKQATVHVQESARKSEGVDFLRVDDLDDERHFSIGVADDVLHHTIDVLRYERIVQGLSFTLDLIRIFMTEFDLSLDRVLIAATLFADVAPPDGVDVLYALGVHPLQPKRTTHVLRTMFCYF